LRSFLLNRERDSANKPPARGEMRASLDGFWSAVFDPVDIRVVQRAGT
jgi:hypothetical protein